MKFRILVFASLLALFSALLTLVFVASGKSAQDSDHDLEHGLLNLNIAARADSKTPIVTTLDGHEIPMALDGAWKSRSLQAVNSSPLSSASGDFDEDGIPDLVAGYSTD